MEKLTRRSDSAAETPSGHLAVVPLARSGSSEGTSWFEFKAHMLSEVVRVEWPSASPVIVLDADMAKSMVRLGYAAGVSDALLDEYNSAVDQYNAKTGESPAAKVDILPPTHTPLSVQNSGPAPSLTSPAPPVSAPAPAAPAVAVQPAVVPDVTQLQAPAPSPPPAQAPVVQPSALDLLNSPPPTPAAG